MLSNFVTLNLKNKLAKNIVVINICLITIWVFLLMSADLKGEIHHWIHWLITAAILPFIGCQYIFYPKKIPSNFYTCSGYLLIAAILLNLFTAQNKIYNLEEALKLLLIFSAYFIFAYNYSFIKAAMMGLKISAICNFLLLVAGALGISSLAHIKYIKDFRWLTILNWPGSLEKAGLVIFCYALYLTLIGKDFFTHWFLFFVSIILVLFDGSRTGLCVIYLGYFIVPLFILMNDKYKINSKFIVTLCFAIFTFFFANFIKQSITINSLVTTQYEQSSNSLSEKGYSVNSQNRLTAFINKLKFGWQGLKESDPIRYRMIQVGLEHIHNNPIFGTGLGTTTVPVVDPENGKMMDVDVHNSYLQVWGNLGILGFIAFLIIILGWVYYLPDVLISIQKANSAIQKALLYNSIFILFYCAINYLTHPLSTEWSEWIMYLIANAFLINIIKKETI